MRADDLYIQRKVAEKGDVEYDPERERELRSLKAKINANLTKERQEEVRKKNENSVKRRAGQMSLDEEDRLFMQLTKGLSQVELDSQTMIREIDIELLAMGVPINKSFVVRPSATAPSTATALSTPAFDGMAGPVRGVKSNRRKR